MSDVGGKRSRAEPFLKARPLGSRSPLKLVAALALAAAILSAPAVTLSSTFVLYRASITSKPVPPPLTLLIPQTPAETAVLGPNATSASITLNATAGWKEITRNGDFLNGPDGWLFINGTYFKEGFWLPYALGAYGVVKLNGSIPTSSIIAEDSAFICQSVVIPNTSINDIEVNVTYYFNTTSPGGVIPLYEDLDVSLLDANGNVVWEYPESLTSNAWENVTFTIPTTYVTPGDTYTLRVGIFVALLSFSLTSAAYYNLSLYFDAVRMYVNVTYPTFAGYVLLTNVSTGSYLAGLRAAGLAASGLVNASVALMNLSGVSTASISVVDSSLETASTSTVNLTVPPPGYVSGRVWVSATLSSGSSATLNLMLVYGAGGAVVEYPITIRIIDPPQAGGGAGGSAPRALAGSATELMRCPSCSGLGSRR